MAKTPSQKVSSQPQDDLIHPLARPFLWLGDQKVIDGFIWLPVIGLIVSVVLGYFFPFYEGHAAPWDFFASWGVIGFVAYTFVVLSAEPLFRFLSRPENYYEEEVEPEIIVAPKVEVHHHD